MNETYTDDDLKAYEEYKQGCQRLRIESDGTPMGTRLLVDDKPIPNVMAVSWEIKGFGHLAEAVIRCEHVPVELTGGEFSYTYPSVWQVLRVRRPFARAIQRLRAKLGRT